VRYISSRRPPAGTSTDHRAPLFDLDPSFIRQEMEEVAFWALDSYIVLLIAYRGLTGFSLCGAYRSSADNPEIQN